MSHSVNEARILGYCGGSPEPLTGGGIAFSVATTEQWNDRTTNAPRERTDWHRVVMFGARAEGLAPIIRKGLRVYVSGRIRCESYTDKDNVKRYSVDLVADDVVILTPKPEGDKTAPRADRRDNPASEAAR